MDDDVVPAPDCLEVLLAQDEDCLMAVREDTAGRLVEKAALRFDLATRWRSGPRRRWSRRRTAPARRCRSGSSWRTSPSRGSWSAAASIDAIGLPDPTYFIFYDDVDFAVRARRAGFRIWAVRDAVLVRQLDFDQQHDLAAGRAIYMYRNLFVGALPVRRERAGPAQAVARSPAAWSRSARCAAAGPRRAM